MSRAKNLNIYLTSILILFFLVARESNAASFDTVIKSVSEDIFSVWTYKQIFPNIDSLLLDEDCLNDGIAVDGKKAKESIQKMTESALKGNAVSLFILGGSPTLGADLGPKNLQLNYHNALADWWNKTIGKATGSHMGRKIVAVGGVGTTYFGHCWQEYVDENDKFDFVTWEFAINDPDSLQYEKAVERFTRDVLSMPSKPGLAFVNFASKSKIRSGSSNKCKRHEDDAKTVDLMAKHYSSISLRWERSLCSCKKLDVKKNVDKFFKKNHPKVIGHAQVAFMLINYFKKIIVEFLKEKYTRHTVDGYIDPSGNVPVNGAGLFPNNGIPSLLPPPIFMTKEDINLASKCFTAITPGPTNPPKHGLQDLQVLHNSGFSLLKVTPWDAVPETRFDATGGYIAEVSGKSLKLKFTASEQNPTTLSQLSVTVRNKYFGGKVKFVLNERTPNEKVVHADTSEKKKAGTNTIDIGSVTQGDQTLSIYTETGGCNLCAIIID